MEIRWKPWAKIIDSHKLLYNRYITISNYKSNIENCTAWWRLKEFYLDMLDKAKQQE